MAILAAFMVPHPPMIVPAIGRGSEKQISETTQAYRRAAEEIAALRPDTLIVTSPHAILYADYFHISPGSGASGSFRQFRAPDVRFSERYDTALVKRICELADAEDFPAGTLGERDPALDHGTMVPLWFIRQVYTGGKLVRIGLSGLSLCEHYRLGQLIARAAEDTGTRAVLIASGDLSHKLQPYGPYGFAPEGPEYDRRIMDVCSRAAFGELLEFDEVFCEKAAECGHRSFVILAGAVDGLEGEAARLSHEDITGVGYGICIFHPQGPSEERHFLELQDRGEELSGDPWVQLARTSVEHYVTGRQIVDVPEGLPEELTGTRAGAFVSIHKHGQLRGCIGTIAPVRENLAREIIHNAVSAAVRDPRFRPIRPEELKDLEISVDVLTVPEDISSEAELDVKKYGVIVSNGMRRGLLLPDLEGVDTVGQQVAIARQKAGIGPGEPIKLQRFEAIRHI